VSKFISLSNKSIGLILLLVGVLVILVAIVVAFNAFYTYKLPEIRGSSLEELISSLINILVEIALRLGFLGLAVWAAGILLKYGVSLLK